MHVHHLFDTLRVAAYLALTIFVGARIVWAAFA